MTAEYHKHESWYLTAPWEPILARRGDPLGLRAGADHFADLLAPGLSNGASDARWISLLSWCLKWSHVAWMNAGGGDLLRREGQRDRYAWLRPLELMWIDRALDAGQATGQLRGRRSIERWRKADRRPLDFAMTPDQFRRYRQLGTYGAYRVILRTTPNLTHGDGWTPNKIALELAALVNESLPWDAQLEESQFEKNIKWGRWSNGNESRFWVERGWRNSSSTVGGYLPTADDAIGGRLTEAERLLLEPILFGISSTRRAAAVALARAKTARSHADLCYALATSGTLTKRLEPYSIGTLPAFSRLADAAMHTMRGLWYLINHDMERQAQSIDVLARSPGLESSFDRLRDASDAWLRAEGTDLFPHSDVVTRLAQTMSSAATPVAQLMALTHHHVVEGGGRRWFRAEGEKIVPLVPWTAVAASDYRFRLRSLARLAAQCGVANMKVALAAASHSEFDVFEQYEADEDEGNTL